MKKIIISTLLVSLLILSGCSSSDKSNGNKTSESTKPQAGILKDGKTVCGDPALDVNTTHTVEFNTTKGSFTVELDVKNAPVSAAHLAALVKSGFYDGLTFHRVIKDFMIQGGDPNGDGTGSSDCSVISETPPRDYDQGDFAWAKTGTDPAGTAGSQFFIITGTSNSPSVAFLNQKTQAQNDDVAKIQYGYAGTVTKGIDVVLAIEALSTGDEGIPSETITISNAKLNS